MCPVGGTVLSIRDEMENVFVWEHLQNSEDQSRGAWLGMNFNPKGGYPVWGGGEGKASGYGGDALHQGLVGVRTCGRENGY